MSCSLSCARETRKYRMGSQNLPKLFKEQNPGFIKWALLLISRLSERAELPEIPIKPLISGAVRKTSQAALHVAKAFINLISRGEFISMNEDDGSVEVNFGVTIFYVGFV
ncbi:hypothetical protein Droror1_Dr00002497 [Drosera rotundifolia]